MDIKGQYIVFEGPGFSGKSKVLRMVAEELEGMGVGVVETREPGGCVKAEAIRKQIFKKKAAGELSPKQEAELFYGARAINMTEVVKPAVWKGMVVLKDRDFMSTFMYQEASGMSREEIAEIHKDLYINNGFPDPDLRLMLQISEATLEKRLGRGDDGDPFDDGCLEMVRLYNVEALNLSERGSVFGHNTEVVNANRPIEVVRDECLRLVKERLGIGENKDENERLKSTSMTFDVISGS
jgi:dTMP kinase